MPGETPASSQACVDIGEVADRLELNEKTQKTAESLVESVYDGDLYFGRKREETLCSVLLISCRQTGDVVPTEQIAGSFGVTEEKMFAATRYLSQNLPTETALQFDCCSVVRHVCNSVGASPSYTIHAVETCQEAMECNLHSGRSPSGFAAGVVYATGLQHENEAYTQQTVADAADVTTVTVRERYEAFTDLHAHE